MWLSIRQMEVPSHGESPCPRFSQIPDRHPQIHSRRVAHRARPGSRHVFDRGYHPDSSSPLCQRASRCRQRNEMERGLRRKSIFVTPATSLSLSLVPPPGAPKTPPKTPKPPFFPPPRGEGGAL